MQFKHPEILYALFALLIPIFIHLFQLQRFTKVSFTNVSFLKQIELQTRKSSRLKKWLVLLARLLAFAALIIAFAQPFYSKIDRSKSWHSVVYVDNSLSMQAKGERGELLKRAIQDLATSIPDKGTYSLITNNQVLTDVSNDDLKEHLKNIDYSPSRTSFKTIVLKSQQIQDKHSNQHQKLFLISDFQRPLLEEETKSIENSLAKQKSKINIIQLTSRNESNIAIDSVYVSENNFESRTIAVLVKNQGKALDNVSLSAFQEQIIIAKTSFAVSENDTQKIVLRIPNSVSNVKLHLDYLDRYSFDNTYYISFQNKERIKVLLLSKENSFLRKIYTKEEFDFKQMKSSEIGYDVIEKQNLVVVEGLGEITTSLQDKLVDFLIKGGHLVLIPAKNDQVETMNLFFNRLNIGQLQNTVRDSLHVTKIHYEHPILKNVFEKEVKNFQYPKVNTYFVGPFRNSQPILSFENQQAFITSFAKNKGSIYWIASPLDIKSSNFTSSPLIVPVFYNIAKNSIKQLQLSYLVGVENQLPVSYDLQRDAVLRIVNSHTDFIPRQQILADKVILFTDEEPLKPGFYQIKDNEKSIQNLAYNYNKDESNLSFLNMNKLTNANIQSVNSIENAFLALSNEQSTTAYFMWFVLLALLFLLIEILLLKYF